MKRNLINTKFFIAKNGHDYARLDARALFLEVKAGRIYKDSYVFEEELDRWVHLISHKGIPSVIKNEALFCDSKVEEPDFKPKDEIIVKEIGSVDSSIVSLLETKLGEIDSKMTDFQRPLSVESDISKISSKLESLEKSFARAPKSTNNNLIEQVSKNLIDLKDEIIKSQEVSLNSESFINIEERIDQVLTEKVEKIFNDKFQKLTEKVESIKPVNTEQNLDIDLEEKFSKIDSVLEKLLDQNKDIKDIKEQVADRGDDHLSATMTRLEDHIRELNGKVESTLETTDGHNQVQQEKFDKLYVKYKNQVMENKVMKDKLDKAVRKMNILHERVNEMAQAQTQPQVEVAKPSLEELVEAPVGEAAKIIELSRPEKSRPEKSRTEKMMEEEDFDEILGLDDLKNGKSFEVTNNCKWMIDNGEGVLGPYRYDQMLKLKSTGKVSNETLIKIQGKGVWKHVSDFIELTAQSKILKEDKENPENSVYLVERSEYRAEVHELVNFTIDGIEHKGYLTNLSLGGGFVELTRLDEEEIKIGSQVTLYLDAPAFSESIVCDLKIRRVSKKRPKGFGFSFEANSEKNLEVLGQFIVDHISGAKKAGSTAA